jgi:hypothetical protein
MKRREIPNFAGNDGSMEQRLFDDDVEEFLLPGSQEKFAGLTEIDLFPKIIYGQAVDFDTLLLD